MATGAWDLDWEIERQQEQERRLDVAIRAVEEDERRVEEELAKVDEQVAYYDALTRDMKREVGRPGLSAILRSFRR